jgi:hypothetical protein
MMLIDYQDPTSRQRLTNAEGIYPSWTSDGSRVALAEGGCVVALYDVALKEFSLSPYAQLTFPENMCAIGGIAPPPGGSSLAVVDADAWKVEVLSLAQLPPPTPGRSSISSLTITPAMLHVVGSTERRVIPAWKRTGSAWTLTFDEYETSAVIEVNLMTQSTTTLFKVPDGLVSALAWVPASDQLVFAVSKFDSWLCYDCSPSYSPSRLYVYTPTA